MSCSSSTRHHPPPVKVPVVVGVFSAVLLLTFSGCASTDSDLPWNNPQPWEGSPMIPGMTPPQ